MTPSLRDAIEPGRSRRSTPYDSRLLGPSGQSARRLRVRVQLLLTGLLVATNLIGAALVIVISYVIIPVPAPNRTIVVASAIAVPVYVVGAVVLGALVGTTTALRALRWIVDEDEAPDDRARARVFQVPFRLTILQFALWAGGTVLFTLLAVFLQPERAITTGLTIGTATAVVCGIAYLLAEFALRPVTARALAEIRSSDRPRGVGIRSRMVIFWAVGTGVPVVTLLVAGVLALTGQGGLTRLAVSTIVVSAVVLVFGLSVTVLGARAVESPVRSVRRGMRAVARGDLDAEVVVYDGTELGVLQAGFNQMAQGLRERERLRDLFGRHVGHEVARQAADGLGEIELGGEVRRVTVLFVDLVGSTGFAEQHAPADVVAMLNAFFGVAVTEVDSRGGLVNKFVGDAVLAVFGAPVELQDHATAGLTTARRISERLAEELPEITAGVGVATGEVVVGNVGHAERFEYTVIGDAVNAASRLTDLAKKVPGRALATAITLEESADSEAQHWQVGDEVELRGRSTPVRTASLRRTTP